MEELSVDEDQRRFVIDNDYKTGKITISFNGATSYTIEDQTELRRLIFALNLLVEGNTSFLAAGMNRLFYGG
jgi:hypothetical protein